MFSGTHLAMRNSYFCTYSNKLLLFVPATKDVAFTGRANARRKAKRYVYQ
ncbi:hypothetical protein MAH4_36540 [Sessilibacter sp. MAH4]